MQNTRTLRSSVWLSFVFALVPVTVAAQDAKKPESKPAIVRGMAETQINREVFTGNEARIAAMNWINADCTSGPVASLRIATPPQNGTLRQEEITMPADRKADDPRFGCNGKPVQAVAVFYKSNAGYTGADNVVIDVDFKTGTVRRFSYKITVR